MVNEYIIDSYSPVLFGCTSLYIISLCLSASSPRNLLTSASYLSKGYDLRVQFRETHLIFIFLITDIMCSFSVEFRRGVSSSYSMLRVFVRTGAQDSIPVTFPQDGVGFEMTLATDFKLYFL